MMKIVSIPALTTTKLVEFVTMTVDAADETMDAVVLELVSVLVMKAITVEVMLLATIDGENVAVYHSECHNQKT